VITLTITTVSCSSTTSSTTTPTTPTTEASSGPPAGFTAFTNESPAFTIAYPATWKTTTKVSGAVVAFLAPASSGSDTFSENVNVLHQTVATGTTLQQYTDRSIQSAGQVVGDFKQVSAGTTTLSGLPAERIEYTGTVSGASYHFFAEWAVTGTDAWVLTYTGQPAEFPTYLSDAQTTIASFQLG
jgi:hypothetical protein